MNAVPQSRAEVFQDRVRRDWDDPETIAAWRKWSQSNSQVFDGVTRALVAAAETSAGQAVLDLASGSGQPALALAAAVGPQGHVTATDMSAGMLAVAEENAQRAGLSNLRFRQAAAESLPFPDRVFDRVTCRFGAMFFIDPVGAMRECRRVLLPRGRATFVVWGHPQQPFFAMTAGVLRNHVSIPEPEPDSPHIFRFAAPGTLSDVMKEAGFRPVHEEAKRIQCERIGTPEDFWQEFREVAAPFRPLIATLAQEKRVQLDAEVLAAMRLHYSGDRMRFYVHVNVASGTAF